MTTKIYLLLSLLLAACSNNKPTEKSLLVPVDAKKVTVVNYIDKDGKKQGLWHELDTVNNRIAKQLYYKDDLLDSLYIVYKTDSPDTLILGYYKLGKKHGGWKYWDTNSNKMSRSELYENDILKERKPYGDY